MLGLDARAARATWTVVAILGLVWALYEVRRTLLLFVVALLFAYLLLPVVDRVDQLLQRRLKNSRVPALAVVYTVLIVVLVWASASLGTAVSDEATTLAKQLPALLTTEQPPLDTLPESVRPYASRLFEWVHTQLTENVEDVVAYVSQAGIKAIGVVFSLLFVIIVPILSFFFLKDGHAILQLILTSMPDLSNRAFVRDIGVDMNVLLAQYMRALVLLGLITSFSYGLFFTLMGVPYGLLLATLAFPLEFIPMLGPLASTAIILLVAAFSGYSHVLWVIVFLAVYRMIQDYVIQPKLMSEGMELHPVMVIFGVMAGEQLAGVWGAFLSVPILATVRILYRRAVLARAGRMQATKE